jgi:adenosine kinase
LDQILEHVKVLVITRGKDGADLYLGGDSVHIPTVPEEEIVDPTGVGDAFRGGFLAGYSNGFNWKLCGEIGSLSAVYCLEQRGTQNHSYSRKEFVGRFRKHFDDNGKLDGLL